MQMITSDSTFCLELFTEYFHRRFHQYLNWRNIQNVSCKYFHTFSERLQFFEMKITWLTPFHG